MTDTAASSTDRSLFHRSGRFSLSRGSSFGMILLAALIAFELFNFSTTEYSLGDLLGKLTFAGVRWSTILALAFCGIDFAGIARLFTPEKVAHEASEVWYLFGAWLLAATMNAILTWWGVSMAILGHPVQSTEVLDPSLLTRIVPIFVAVMVWLIRILIIGTLSYAGDRLFLQSEPAGRTVPMLRSSALNSNLVRGVVPQPVPTMMARPHPAPAAPASARVQPAPGMASAPAVQAAPRPEPTYHRMSARPGRPVSPQQHGISAD